MTCTEICTGQPFLGLIPVAFVCQLEEITWIQKLGKSKVLIGTKTEGDSWPLCSCPGVSQGYRQEQLHLIAGALVRKQPRPNRRKDPMPPDSEISEKQLDHLGEPCCLQPWGEGGVWRQTTTRATLAPRILKTGKEAFTVWQMIRAGIRWGFGMG